MWSEFFSTTQQQIITVAAVMTAILVISTFIKKLSDGVKKISHFLDDFFGEVSRPGVPARPGMNQRLSDLEEAVGQLGERRKKYFEDIELIKAELFPNHGSSLRDAINRIEKRLTDVEDDLK